MNMIEKLQQQGVILPDPAQVHLGPEVVPGRIGAGVTLCPGTRISGKDTCVLPGAVLGAEGPVVVDSCQVGPKVSLKSGYFSQAVFLEGASMGAGAHVRAGTILEEQASGAHTVGLKQTILFPFATLGSVINFCDVLLAGGTSRKNHSEVGSSYIHFNYTPQQDKSTASLLGDVPRGVMLDQNPIFLGGQGGLVGPSRMEYGTVVAAGCVWRKDQLKPDRLVSARPAPGVNIAFIPGLYRSVGRTIKNNAIYLANLLALGVWYKQVRVRFFNDPLEKALFAGLLEKWSLAVDERVKRLEALAEKMPHSIDILQNELKSAPDDKEVLRQKQFHDRWPQVKEAVGRFRDGLDESTWPHDFFASFKEAAHQGGGHYLETIQALDPAAREKGSAWLQGITDRAVAAIYQNLPPLA